jgi:hypothetical protein
LPILLFQYHESIIRHRRPPFIALCM